MTLGSVTTLVKVATAASRLIGATALCVGLAMPTGAQEAVSEDAIQQECAQQAATAFEQSPSDVMTLGVERTVDGYRVSGQYPLEGDDITPFSCTFRPDGTFESVGPD